MCVAHFVSSVSGVLRRGIYFAENSAYSHNYAFKPLDHPQPSSLVNHRPLANDDEHEMFLSRLLVGNAIEMERNDPQTAVECQALTAPPIDATTNLRYNTVTGQTKGSKVYIVYENGRAYPEYLVRYYRRPKRDLHRTRYGTKAEAKQWHKPDSNAGVSVRGKCTAAVWEFLDTDDWKSYAASHQQVLESAYQAFLRDNRQKLVDLQGRQWTYQVDLATMVQTNTEHSDATQRLVQRRATLVPMTAGKLATATSSGAIAVWEFMDDAKRWTPYCDSEQGILEDAYLSYANDNTSHKKIVDIHTAYWSYQVNVATMVQTNVEHANHTQRRDQRRVVLVNAAKDLVGLFAAVAASYTCSAKTKGRTGP